MPIFFKSFRSPVVLLSIGMLLTTGVAVFFAFKYSKLAGEIDIAGTVDTTKCGSCIGYNNVSPAKCQLELNLLKQMAFNYQNSIPTTGTRSVWFSLETVKKFIYSIEKKTCNTCAGNLGIRMYLAQYPTTGPSASYTDLTIVDANYSGINTLFMVPTVDIGNYHYDFDPAFSCNPYKLPKMDTSGYYPPGGTIVTAIMSQNHGDACPPPPQGQTCPQIGAYFNK